MLSARIVIFDACPPTSSDTCQTVRETLEKLLVLVCNLSGPCRLPYFGLTAVGYNEHTVITCSRLYLNTKVFLLVYNNTVLPILL